MKRISLLALCLCLLAAAAPAQDTDCVTRSDLADYALLSDLAAYTPLSALAGYVTSADLAGYALLSDLSAYAPLSALDDYATTDDLANYTTAADLAAACNARLPATPNTIGSNTVWIVSRKTEFDAKLHATGGFEAEGDALFNDPVSFDDDVVFNAGLVLGGETRTNWNDVQSLTVPDDESAYLTANHGFVWTFPEENNVHVYLPNGPAATNRTRTVVVRHIESGIGGTATEVYDGPSSTNILHSLTSTNPTAVFDWCPPTQSWLLR